MTEEKQELHVDDRRSKILELLAQKGKVRVTELSKLFEISEVTIRNDLSELEANGLLERVHGGAATSYKSYVTMPIHERMKTNEPEKRAIAKAVAGMISDSDTVLISSGTTTAIVAQELKQAKNLTVVTNSIAVAQELGQHRAGKVILLGGDFNVEYQFTYGDDTLNQLRKYKADKLILSVDGVSAEGGLSSYLHLEAEIYRQMMARVNRTIIVADHAKIGRTSFAHIDTIDKVDVLVTNQKASQEEIRSIADKGIEVVLV